MCAVLLAGLPAAGRAQSVLGRSAPGQPSAPMPNVLTPLGPPQSAPPSAPIPPATASAPPAGVSLDQKPAAIESQPLPVLTAPPSTGPAQDANAPTVPPAAPAPGGAIPTAPAPLGAIPTAPVPSGPIRALPMPGGAGPSAPAAPLVSPAPAAPDAATPAHVLSDWVARQGVRLTALDKVTARSETLRGTVGGTLTFHSLSIAVRACVARPADQPQDYAAYLDITDATKSAPGFHGWMLADEPSAAMLEHPVYDIRLLACTAGP
ncbi:MAG: DUF2155 domain-containing protein [Rhodospirillales bacterium]|nr:DUF2155 domain-containing protein [Rhodospirillales bacterium]